MGRVDTVDDEAVLGTGSAVDRDAAEEAFLGSAGRLRGDAGEVAAFGQQLDLLRADRGRGCGVLDVDLAGFADHADRLGDGADFERDVRDDGLAEADRNVLNLSRVEAVELRDHHVGARGHAGEPEGSGLVRGARQAGATGRDRFHGRAREDRARRVTHGTLDRAHLLLGACRGDCEQRHEGEGRNDADIPPISLVQHHRTSIRLIGTAGGTIPASATWLQRCEKPNTRPVDLMPMRERPNSSFSGPEISPHRCHHATRTDRLLYEIRARTEACEVTLCSLAKL